MHPIFLGIAALDVCSDLVSCKLLTNQGCQVPGIVSDTCLHKYKTPDKPALLRQLVLQNLQDQIAVIITNPDNVSSSFNAFLDNFGELMVR